MDRWIARAKIALSWIRRAATPSEAGWTGATWALVALWAIPLLVLIVDEIIPFLSLEQIAGLITVYGIFFVATLAILLLLWLARLLKPRYRFALVLVLPPLALFALGAWVQGAAIAIPVVLAGLSLFFGSLLALRRTKGRPRLGTIVYGAIGAAILATSAYAYFAPQADLNPALRGFHLKGKTLPLPNPAAQGPYKVAEFTYGSGSDLRRPEYAGRVRFVTHSVDGHKLDLQWTGFGGWLRTRYWGFDAAHMPLQGRVWMPEGKGPFPLVLIVHGNHRMEESSDPGYGFLGKVLASQGFIFVSVDENFLNGSLAEYADPFHLRLGDENKARAWLLLEHLKQWRTWNSDSSSPLHEKVDLDRLALIGHSRGGEAVATANAFNDLHYFPDDATVPFDFHFHLRAIVAIAPVDGQYKPRDWPTPMRDTNYFVIQGGMDGDMFSFLGSSQYLRATFSGTKDAFKASLYVRGANHGQFNQSWGRNDLVGQPGGYLLDERPIMDPAAQQQILKVYVAAFLHAALGDEAGYRPLFADPRNGASWLPDDYLVGDYADSRTVWLANYSEDLDPATATDPSVTIGGDNLSVWKEDYPQLKFAPFWSPMAFIGWDDRVHKAHAAYRLAFREPRALPPEGSLVFSASQAEIETVPKEVTLEGERQVENTALDFTVRISDAEGHVASLPLSHDSLLYPQLKSETRRVGQIDFIPSSEIVFRRFRFPLADFKAAAEGLDLDHVKEIALVFDRSKRGAIALTDLGVAPGN